MKEIKVSMQNSNDPKPMSNLRSEKKDFSKNINNNIVEEKMKTKTILRKKGMTTFKRSQS